MLNQPSLITTILRVLTRTPNGVPFVY